MLCLWPFPETSYTQFSFRAGSLGGGEKERTQHELVLVSQDFRFGHGRGEIDRESLVTVARIQWTRQEFQQDQSDKYRCVYHVKAPAQC